ncbi:MAG: outer membrane beta-barrel protein [Tidjanibacter sp.]|nr:outer membrane beta-barrel protein [Tidjanibacter sp.]
MASTDGGVVCLATKRDTLFTVALNNKFRFENVPLGPAEFTFMHINFDTAQQKYEVKGDKNEVRITVQQKSRVIETITVTGEMPLITVLNDTLRFNAAAVKMMEGEVALDFLKQVPGAEVSPEGIKIYGENVSRTYVNQKLLFGRDAMTALRYIPAAELVSIDTYVEATQSLEIGAKPTERVLNIRTKTPMVSSMVTDALASYGGTESKSDFLPKYHAGLTGNFFSEKWLLSGNIIYGNMNRNSNSSYLASLTEGTSTIDNRRFYAEAGIDRSWTLSDKANDYIIAGLRYALDNNRSFSESWSRRDYLPTADYASRFSSDSLSSLTNIGSHNFSAKFVISRPKFGLNYNGNLTLSNNSASTNQSSTTMLDDDYRFNLTTNTTEGRSLSIGNLLGTMIWLSKTIYLSANASQNYNSGNSNSVRVDSLYSSPLKTIVETSPPADNTSLSAGVKFGYAPNDKLSFTVSYNASRENSVYCRTAIDISDPLLPVTDSVNTYFYTRNYRRSDAAFESILFTKHNYQFMVGLNLASAEVMSDRHFPEESHGQMRYTAFLPSLSIFRSMNKGINFNLRYRTDMLLPSIEQWQARLDTRNPIALQAGNPNLKNGYLHSLSFTFTPFTADMKAPALFSFNASANLTTNTIAAKTTYFTEATPLPEWDYTAQPQSTLTTYQNMGSTLNSSLDITRNGRLPKNKGSYKVSVGCNYTSTPSFFLGRECRTNILSPEGKAGISYRPSRRLNIVLSGTVRYIDSQNTLGQQNRVMNYTGRASATVNYHKLFLSSSYSMSYYQSLSGSVTDRLNNVLGAVVGVKLLNNKMTISLSANDILNNSSNFSTLMRDDYVLNSWTRSFGRFYTINIAWKLFRSKSGLSQPEHLDMNDSRIKSNTERDSNKAIGIF